MQRHHIVPRHIGGTDDPNNIRSLTIEQHAEAHRLLWEQYGRWQDRAAWLLLSKHTEEGWAILTREGGRRGGATWKGKTHSVETRAKLSKIFKNTTHTDEAKAKISAGLKGHSTSDERKAKISASLKGYQHTPEACARMSASRLGRKRGPYKHTHKYLYERTNYCSA